MRRLLVALALIAWMPDALAGEFELPTLRGSDTVVPIAPPPVPVLPMWAGFYVGGQVGWGVGNMNFDGTTQPLVAHMLRELRVEYENQVSAWQILGQGDTRSASGGFFIGYNNAWEGMIIGVDFTWSKVNYFLNAPVSPISRLTTTSNDLAYAMTLTGAANMQITDFGVLRVRAGVDLGNVLPYAGIGFAVGRAGVYRSATASGIEYAPNPLDPPNPIETPFFFTENETKSNAVIYGWSLSGGLDIMLMPCLFMRAEFEFVNFQPLWNINSSISTGRVGVGYKF
ncbi:MAG: outer membrane protein [Xanthobacteraceae bacterium]